MPPSDAVALVAVTVARGTSPALAIERQGDWIELRIADVDAGQAAIERELRNAEIRVMPVPAALAGRWACAEAEPCRSLVPTPRPGTKSPRA